MGIASVVLKMKHIDECDLRIKLSFYAVRANIYGVRTLNVNPALPCTTTENLFFMGRKGTTKMRGLRGGSKAAERDVMRSSSETSHCHKAPGRLLDISDKGKKTTLHGISIMLLCYVAKGFHSVHLYCSRVTSRVLIHTKKTNLFLTPCR
jgi:hypothetical protein